MSLVLVMTLALAAPLLVHYAEAKAALSTLIPLFLYGSAWFLTAIWTRPAVFSGDRIFVALTFLLLGFGVVEQLRLGTWELSWDAWKAYLPFITGCLSFLFCIRLGSIKAFTLLLERGRWLLWLSALATLAILFLFGKNYRGALFLPGRINPTELVKLFLVCFASAWLPLHKDALSRTLFGIPIPPFNTCLALAFVWGLPLLGAIAVRDLGLALILSLTLVFMLMVVSGKIGWLLLGGGLAVGAGAFAQTLIRHAGERFYAWQHPFADPLDKGWQIGQSLSAQYAGGLWGTGFGVGHPENVPIVTNDFVYAALAEEWGLIGCACLLLIYWLWLTRAIAISAETENLSLRLLGSGFASVIGTQILLNVAGVTKALPMTGITLPFISQGGFSLLVTLLFCALITLLSRRSRTP